jgi:oligoribonuclease
MVWMDLEMTGLDVEKEVIIEIATIITDKNLNILHQGQSLAINQDNIILGKMDAWNTKHHNASGLVQRVKQSSITLAEAERQTLKIIKEYCPSNVAPLCGNSVGQDRKFLEKYMKEIYAYLHYRSIDVTSIKELIRRWYPDGPQFPKKSGEHRADVDVRESLEELIFYRKYYFTADVPCLDPVDSPSYGDEK